MSSALNDAMLARLSRAHAALDLQHGYPAPFYEQMFFAELYQRSHSGIPPEPVALDFDDALQLSLELYREGNVAAAINLAAEIGKAAACQS